LTIGIRPLAESDVVGVQRMLQASIRPEVFRYTIYSCSGYSDYLRAQIRLPAAMSETLLFGVYRDGAYCGFAEWRRNGRLLHLNNVFVVEAARGAGYGDLLLAYGVRLAGELGCEAMTLDVFAWNETAIRWYAKRGFRLTGATFWHVADSRFAQERAQAREPLPGRIDAEMVVRDYAFAEAQHRAYGFSAFTAETLSGRHTVGRIGDGVFRIRADADEIDGQLAGGLAALDPRRELLVLSPEEKLPGCVSLGASYAMRRELMGACSQ